MEVKHNTHEESNNRFVTIASLHHIFNIILIKILYLRKFKFRNPVSISIEDVYN